MRHLLRNGSFLVGVAVLVPALACMVAPGVIAPHDPNASVGQPLLHPSGQFLLGTDEAGRDLLSRLIWAARVDVGIGIAATTLAAAFGTAIGLIAGFRGRMVDAIVMRTTDVLLAFPSILLAIFLVAVAGHSELVLIGALAVLFVGSWVRLARGLAISLRHRGYVEAAEISGAGGWHVVRWHLLPNASGALLVAYAMTAASALVVTSSLSYVGLGVQPPTASWGVMLQNSFAYVFTDPLYGVLPGTCVTIVALAYTWIADGIDDVATGGATRRGALREFGAGPQAADADEMVTT